MSSPTASQYPIFQSIVAIAIHITNTIALLILILVLLLETLVFSIV